MDLETLTACLFKSANICWLRFKPSSTNNTTDIVSSPKSGLAFNASSISALLF